jgi:hypothetical protein
MNNEQLGFDLTISKKNSKRYIIITRNGKPERLIIDELIKQYLFMTERSIIY